MLLNCDFSKLYAVAQRVSGVVNDPLVGDGDRNIIFCFKDVDDVKELQLIGLTSQIIYKEQLPQEAFSFQLDDADTKDEKGHFFMQLNCKDLLDLFGSFKNLRRTYIEEVSFSSERGKVKCSIVERNIAPSKLLEEELREKGEFESYIEKRIVSYYLFDKIPLKAGRLGLLDMMAEEGTIVDVPKVLLKLVISSLVPNMENSTGVYGSMQFVEDYIMIFNKSFNQVMRNYAPMNQVFKDITLKYRFVSFINKVVLDSIDDDEETLGVARIGKFLYLKDTMSETYVTCSDKLSSYKGIIDSFVKKSYIDIDRLYLKDVLKRFALSQDAVEVTINTNDGCLHLKNSKFEQDISYGGSENIDFANNLHFKIMPNVFMNSILGEDSKMVGVNDDGDYVNADIRLWVCQESRDINIIFSDYTDSWFALVRTSTY